MSWFGLEMIGLENKQEADLNMAELKMLRVIKMDCIRGKAQRGKAEVLWI